MTEIKIKSNQELAEELYRQVNSSLGNLLDILNDPMFRPFNVLTQISRDSTGRYFVAGLTVTFPSSGGSAATPPRPEPSGSCA